VASLVYSFALCGISCLLFCPLWHLSSTLLPSVASLIYSFVSTISAISYLSIYHLRHTTNVTEIYSQWMALHACTSLEGFYVAVRSGIEDLAEPKIFFTEKSQKFVRDVLGIEPQHLGLKLEAFVISKLGMFSLPSSCSLLIVPKMNM
jgi:hypothetical protein